MKITKDLLKNSKRILDGPLEDGIYRRFKEDIYVRFHETWELI